MDPRAHSELLAPWIERLLDEVQGGQRERLLARAALDVTSATGAAVWRLDSRTWRPRVGTGCPKGLPDAGQVTAVADGALDRHLPPDRAVVVVGSLVLALVGVTTADELEHVEALLALALVLDDASPDGEDGPAWPLSDVA